MRNYNIINLSINTALNHMQIGTSGGYIKLLDAPTNAKVFIHLNNSDADAIPLKAYHSIEASDIQQIYISCNAVANETIKIVQAKTSKDFRMSTPSSDLRLEEIGGISDAVVNKLKFVPNGIATQHNIAQNSVTELDTLTLNKIKIHTTKSLAIELNWNGILFPIDGTQEIFLRDIQNIKFHNSDAESAVLTILYMNNIPSDNVTGDATGDATGDNVTGDATGDNVTGGYVDDGYVDSGYIIDTYSSTNTDTTNTDTTTNTTSYVADDYVDIGYIE